MIKLQKQTKENRKYVKSIMLWFEKERRERREEAFLIDLDIQIFVFVEIVMFNIRF